MSEFIELDNGSGEFGIFRISDIKWIVQHDDGTCAINIDGFKMYPKAVNTYENIKKILNPQHPLIKAKKESHT